MVKGLRISSLLFAFALCATFLFSSSSFGDRAETQDNLDPRSGWPSPVMDKENYGMFLVDLLEIDPTAGSDADIDWDLVGWRGGDIHRFWFKTEGSQDAQFSNGGEGDIRLLYGKLISPYFDLQGGLRNSRRWGRRDVSRIQAVIGLQGFAPYRYDIEPEIYVGESGDVSFNFTIEQDFLFSQRLVAQLRGETLVGFKKIEAFDQGSGFNDIEFGLRLRYEILREFAPYLGVNWKKLFGQAADLARAQDVDTDETSVLVGVRAWY